MRSRRKSRSRSKGAALIAEEARVLKRIYLEDLKRWPREFLWELMSWGNPLVEEVLREGS